MQIKKSGKAVYGADFTANEKRAIDLEIQRQLKEYDKKHKVEIDALILWQLHKIFGFGPKRLKKFYTAFGEDMRALIKRYDLEDSDDIWLSTRKLKEYGIDLEQWEKESKR